MFSNISILKKIMIIPIVFIILFGIHFTYLNTQQTLSEKNISSIKNNHLPLKELATKNLNLFHTIDKDLKDAVASNETQWVNNTLELKEEFLENIKKMEMYLKTTKEITTYKNLFLEYYQSATKLSLVLINNNIDVDQNTETLLKEFKIKKAISLKHVETFKNKITNQLYDRLLQTSKVIENSLLTSVIIALLIIISTFIIALLITLPIRKSLHSVISALNNLKKEKPNLITTIEITTNDEIGELISSFNRFSLNVKEDYMALDSTLQQLKETQQELTKAKAKAEEATKTKSLFLANMSHEIRTPMHNIIGMTYFLKETTLTSKQQEYLEKINISSNNLLVIINDILDFSKIEAGKLNIVYEEIDLIEILNRIYSSLEFKAKEKGLKLSITYKNIKNPIVSSDKIRLTQILTNLITNAIKFTEKGSVSIFISKDKNIYRFEITDTGIGLSENQIKILFNSFTQADESTTKKFGGTGLGLAISKQLVELLNGHIWVTSELKKGSSFIFEIPMEEINSQSFITVDENLIKHKISLENTNENLIDPQLISKDEEKNILKTLEISLEKQMPLEIKPIISKLKTLKLSTISESKLNNIAFLSSQYKFKDALKELKDD